MEGLNVAGVHFNRLSPVVQLIGVRFPTFLTYSEPPLHHAQVLRLKFINMVTEYFLHVTYKRRMTAANADEEKKSQKPCYWKTSESLLEKG